MRIVEAGHAILTELDGESIIRRIEQCARTAYRSEASGSFGDAKRFVARIISREHLSVIEHEAVTVRVVCDRAIAHQIVRHRIASYTQESTRYCNYGSDRFGSEITVIRPPFWPEGSDAYETWREAMERAEATYLNLLGSGATPEQARGVLPLSLKTEIVMTMNLRQWRHFFALRTAPDAHPQIRLIAQAILTDLAAAVPIVFDDLAALDRSANI